MSDRLDSKRTEISPTANSTDTARNAAGPVVPQARLTQETPTTGADK